LFCPRTFSSRPVFFSGLISHRDISSEEGSACFPSDLHHHFFSLPGSPRALTLSLIFHLFTTNPRSPGFPPKDISVQTPASCKAYPAELSSAGNHISSASLFAVLPLTKLDISAVNDPKSSISESRSRVTSCRICKPVRCNPSFYSRTTSIAAGECCGR
jgi:hypothetical protein